MVIHRSAGMASNYDCSSCYCPGDFTYAYFDDYTFNDMSPTISPSQATTTVGYGAGFTLTANFQDCNGYNYNYGVTYETDSPDDYTTWDTDDHSVAIFNSPGDATAVGGGTTTVIATYTGPTDWYFTGVGCTCDSTASDDAYATLNVTPSITSLTPSQDPVGDTYTVNISGTGFGANPSANATINAGSNVIVTIDPSSTDTALKAYFLIQLADPGGNHNVTVSTPAGTSNSKPFFVQIPTSVSVYSDTGTSENVCTLNGGGNGCGAGRLIKWQVRDQQTQAQPIQAVMSVYDTIQFTSQNDFGFNSNNDKTTCTPFNTGPCLVNTDANGITPSDVNMLCSSKCISGSTCIGPDYTTVVNQTWHVNSVSVSPNSITIKCSTVLINGQP